MKSEHVFVVVVVVVVVCMREREREREQPMCAHVNMCRLMALPQSQVTPEIEVRQHASLRSDIGHV
jgi:hypothetical protein